MICLLISKHKIVISSLLMHRRYCSLAPGHDMIDGELFPVQSVERNTKMFVSWLIVVETMNQRLSEVLYISGFISI